MRNFKNWGRLMQQVLPITLAYPKENGSMEPRDGGFNILTGHIHQMDGHV